MQTFREFLLEQESGWTADYFGGQPHRYVPVSAYGNYDKQPMDKSQMSYLNKQDYWAKKLENAKHLIEKSFAFYGNQLQDSNHKKIYKAIINNLVAEIDKIKGNYRSNNEQDRPLNPNRKVLGTLNKHGWRESVDMAHEFERVKNYIFRLLTALSQNQISMGPTADKDVLELRKKIASHLLQKVQKLSLKA